MRVKIVKAEKGKWYYKLIGKVRTVKDIRDFGHGEFFILRNYRTLLRTIPVEDCEIYLEGGE
jgi:hypothetical protein